ncbi:MAG TPA: ClpXP protease specificity-enhancing factor SspB [Candidatus Omnitrophota bacterium]|nr:ClpXP protease specificity-enhancing factor SspB [Candidatus Omnitrophota bacterium]
MAEDGFRYDKMVEDALRGVVRDAIDQAAKIGLTGEHHFYITFHTRHPGTKVPDYILARHPDEMTIVLQHQFWGLELDDEAFEVTLSFSGVSERLRVPFGAITGFADPSAKFGLQFQVEDGDDEEYDDDEGEAADVVEFKADPAMLSEDKDKPEVPAGGDDNKVVALDAFRKK